MADDHRFIFPAPEERERARPGVLEPGISEAGSETGESAAWGSPR
jgi:hypothetical protein